jgi:predicted ABC-type ATPase
VFLWLATPDEAIARVALRVRHGGHDIPEPVIRRRYASGLRNFLETYRTLVTYWQWIDNSGEPSLLIEEGTNP